MLWSYKPFRQSLKGKAVKLGELFPAKRVGFSLFIYSFIYYHSVCSQITDKPPLILYEFVHYPKLFSAWFMQCTFSL